MRRLVELSSTTSTRTSRSRSCSILLLSADWRFDAWAWAVKWKVLPLPGSLSTHIFYLSTHKPHQARGNGEAEASASEFAGGGAIDLRKRFENRFLLFQGDAQTSVADGEVQFEILVFSRIR